MTPYDKLIDLFSTVVEETNRLSGDKKTYTKGGKGNLAELLGVSPSLVTHWGRRYKGQPPVDYYERIVDAASTLGIPRYKVDALYGDCRCPTCGKPVVPLPAKPSEE